MYFFYMRQFILLLLFFLAESTAFSETTNFSRWSFTAEYDATLFFGDLTPVLQLIPSSLQDFAFGTSVEYNLNAVWGLSADYYHLPFSGRSKIAYFKTNLHSADLNATINFTKWIFPLTRSKFSISGIIGVGAALFTSRNRYPDPVNSPLIVNDIPSFVSSVPVSFLAEYNLTKFVDLGLKVHYRAYMSDNLEGIPYLNFKGVTNDYIAAIGLSLRYKLDAIKKEHLRNINLENEFSGLIENDRQKLAFFQNNDSCSSCQALEATKENAKLIAKLATNDAKLRKDLDSVLTLLSNYKQDTDGDGVSDIMDKCPQTAQKVRGLVDKHGCPLDSDGDGVPDYEDKCPKTYGDIANNGCPEIKKEVKELFRQALQGIQFETAKAEILPASSVILDKIADILLLNPSYLVEIQGHTDNFGNSSSNLILSESRAEAVRKYLVEKGVNNSRLSSHGYGDTKPVANNNTSEGRSKNRRVEFIVSFEK